MPLAEMWYRHIIAAASRHRARRPAVASRRGASGWPTRPSATRGGFGGKWSTDGKSLYYGSGRAVVEVRLATTPTLRVVSRDTLFRNAPFGLGVDITRDKSRLVFPRAQSGAYPLVVVPNWRNELRERLAANRK